MLSNYHLTIVDFYNSPIHNVKKIGAQLFLKKKSMFFIMKTCSFI